MGAGLLSSSALTRVEIEAVLASAEAYAEGRGNRYPDAVVGLCFFQESLRTRVGFEVAAARLGASAVTLTEGKFSASMSAPESIADALRSVGGWFDVLCIRAEDPAVGPDAVAATGTAVVNCGSGTVEHPTQALVDLHAISRQVGTIDGLRIAFVGNQRDSRSARSLATMLARFDGVRVRDIAPRGLHFPANSPGGFDGGAVEQRDRVDLAGVDVVYVSGLAPLLPDGSRVDPAEQEAMRVTTALAGQLPPGARVLCALPRIDEIEAGVDELPVAGYFEQSRTAVDVRMAVLDRALR